ETQRVPANREISVVCQFKIVRVAVAAHLRAAAIESIEHENGGRLGKSLRVEFLPACLKAEFVEELFAKRAGIRDTENMLGLIGEESALSQIEVADAEIIQMPPIALIFAAQRVRFVQRVLDAGLQVELTRWAAND